MNVRVKPQPGRRRAILALLSLLLCLLFLGLASSSSRPIPRAFRRLKRQAMPWLRKRLPATPTPCPSDPPTGLKSKIVAEDDIVFVYRYKDEGYLRHKTVDLTGPTTLAEVAFKKYSSMDALTSVYWHFHRRGRCQRRWQERDRIGRPGPDERLGVITNGPPTTNGTTTRLEGRQRGLDRNCGR